MRLTRVHVCGPLAAGTRRVLEGDTANHIARVLRLRPGDPLSVFDGSGAEHAARIEEFRKAAVIVTVGDSSAPLRESSLRLTLAQGISRGERMDWVVQKSTELGVSRIVPIQTERSVVKLDPQQSARKLRHWQAIAIAACEQSGRTLLPELAPAQALYDFLGDPDADGTRLLLSPAGSLRVDDLAREASRITVLIGPEGGLSEPEQRAAIAAGFLPVSLGPRILRTETAAVAALTLLQHRFGDL
jgi:16S rRNA (uracil1498-N3)-methyltransferase